MKFFFGFSIFEDGHEEYINISMPTLRLPTVLYAIPSKPKRIDEDVPKFKWLEE